MTGKTEFPARWRAWGRIVRGVLASTQGGKAAQDDAAWFAGWLAGFRFDHSGAPIERHAEAILAALRPATVAKLRVLGQRGDDAAVAKRLLAARETAALSTRARLSLARLEAILRCVADGFPMPDRAAPVYEPVPGRVFYLLHMRRPFETNGYVARTETVMKAMEIAGLEPEPVTRLGFPNDLSRHKAAPILQEETYDGRLYRALADGRGGQTDRPIDDYIRAYADRIVELAKVRRPAAIYAASNFMNGLAGALAARALGIPCIYEMRGLWHVTQASLSPAFETSLRYSLQGRLEIESARRADHVVAISEPLREWAIAQGVSPARISVAANVVDPERFPPRERDRALAQELDIAEDAVVVGYVGSVVRYEGLDLVLRAVAQAPEAVWAKTRVLVVGDGVALEELKELADELGVSAICRFAGRVDPSRAAAFYSLIDIAPFPRRSLRVTELIPPLKPFEAMAAGKAVIVSDVRAMADLVEDGRTGLVVAKDDVAALGEAIARLVMDPALRASLGEAGRASIHGRHDLGAMSQAIAGAFAASDDAKAFGEPDENRWLSEAIGLVADGGGAGLSRLASDFAGAGVGSRALLQALASARRQATERGLAEAAEQISEVARSRADEVNDVAALVGRAAAALVAAGDGQACVSYIERLCDGSADDRIALAALDAAAREAGRLSDQTLEAEILNAGLKRFSRSGSFAWRAARALHRAGDYARARRIAPGSKPPDRRALEMTRDFAELDGLPAALKALTGAPRDHSRGDVEKPSVLYAAFNAFPYATGGYATRTHGMVSALRAAGTPVSVLVRSSAVKGGKALHVEWRNDVGGVPYLHSRAEVASGRFMRCRQFADLVKKTIASQSPTLVHAASNFEIGLPSVMTAAAAGLPAVYEVRGFWEITRASGSPDFLRHPLFRRNLCAEIAACLLADRVVTLNASMKSLLVDCGVPEAAIDLVPNAAPIETFQPRGRDEAIAARLGLAPDDLVIGYVGSFLPYEGIELLVEAFDAVAGSIQKLKLVLVGDHEPAGPRSSDYFDTIAARIRSSRHANRIVLHPRVPYDQVPDFYSVIDIAPFPRRALLVTEMISPMKPREAMAMGKAAAISRVGGLTSIVEDGVTGMVFAPDDAGDLAACLKRLVEDEPLRRRLGENALAEVRASGSWRTGASVLAETYRAAAAESRFRDPDAWMAAGRQAAALLSVDRDPSAARRVLAAVDSRMRALGL